VQPEEGYYFLIRRKKAQVHKEKLSAPLPCCVTLTYVSVAAVEDSPYLTLLSRGMEMKPATVVTDALLSDMSKATCVQFVCYWKTT